MPDNSKPSHLLSTQKDSTQKDSSLVPTSESSNRTPRTAKRRAAPADAAGVNGDDLLLKLLAKRAGKFRVELSGRPPDWFPQFSKRIRELAITDVRLGVWVDQLTPSQLSSWEALRTALNIRAIAFLDASARGNHEQGGTMQ